MESRTQQYNPCSGARWESGQVTEPLRASGLQLQTRKMIHFTRLLLFSFVPGKHLVTARSHSVLTMALTGEELGGGFT